MVTVCTVAMEFDGAVNSNLTLAKFNVTPKESVSVPYKSSEFVPLPTIVALVTYSLPSPVALPFVPTIDVVLPHFHGSDNDSVSVLAVPLPACVSAIPALIVPLMSSAIAAPQINPTAASIINRAFIVFTFPFTILSSSSYASPCRRNHIHSLRNDTESRASAPESNPRPILSARQSNG
jgi:hypothetical protein